MYLNPSHGTYTTTKTKRERNFKKNFFLPLQNSNDCQGSAFVLVEHSFHSSPLLCFLVLLCSSRFKGPTCWVLPGTCGQPGRFRASGRTEWEDGSWDANYWTLQCSCTFWDGAECDLRWYIISFSIDKFDCLSNLRIKFGCVIHDRSRKLISGELATSMCFWFLYFSLCSGAREILFFTKSNMPEQLVFCAIGAYWPSIFDNHNLSKIICDYCCHHVHVGRSYSSNQWVAGLHVHSVCLRLCVLE